MELNFTFREAIPVRCRSRLFDLGEELLTIAAEVAQLIQL